MSTPAVIFIQSLKFPVVVLIYDRYCNFTRNIDILKHALGHCSASLTTSPHDPLHRVNVFHTLVQCAFAAAYSAYHVPSTHTLCASRNPASERVNGSPCTLTAYCPRTADTQQDERPSTRTGPSFGNLLISDGRAREGRRVSTRPVISKEGAARSSTSCMLVGWAPNPTGRGRGAKVMYGAQFHASRPDAGGDWGISRSLLFSPTLRCTHILR